MSHTKIYLVSAGDCFINAVLSKQTLPQIERDCDIEFCHDKILASFHYLSDLKRVSKAINTLEKLQGTELFLDSGAFSAYTQGSVINLQEYIDFVKMEEEQFTIVANLDSIGDPKQTWKNQKEMEKQGIDALPCFHVGEDIKWLRKYIKKYDYIALGGMVPYAKKSRVLTEWLDTVFKDHICGDDLMPRVKVHGFGLTNRRLMMRYPWYSVDSSSWVNKSRGGEIFVPKKNKAGEFDFTQTPLVVRISLVPVSREFEPITFEKRSGIVMYHTLPTKSKRHVEEYLESINVPLGFSRYRIMPIEKMEGFPLNKYNQKIRRHNAAVGKALLETIDNVGVTNGNRVRDHVVTYYYKMLEKTLTYPRPFKAWNDTIPPMF